MLDMYLVKLLRKENGKAIKMKNYFAFIDESGNSTQERFFGLGLLVIDDEIGDFYDSMKPFYDKARDIARENKMARIKELYKLNELKQVAQIAGSSKKFELKFKYINSTNKSAYLQLIEKYFSFSNVRFCSLVIDRQKGNTGRWKPALNPWDIYIHQAAMLISNNIKNISPCQICVLADDLTKPSNVSKSFELSLTDAISARLNKQNMKDKIFGVSRLESHSSLLLQVVDILLGAVMFDFKKQSGLISSKLEAKQELIVSRLRSKYKTDNLAINKTYHNPNYFSIWEFNPK